MQGRNLTVMDLDDVEALTEAIEELRELIQRIVTSKSIPILDGDDWEEDCSVDLKEIF